MQWWTIPNHMELEDPPEPEETASMERVLDVMFGRAQKDELGRDFDALMNDTAMTDIYDHLAFRDRAEKELWRFIGENWERIPKALKYAIEEQAIKAAEE